MLQPYSDEAILFRILEKLRDIDGDYPRNASSYFEAMRKLAELHERTHRRCDVLWMAQVACDKYDMLKGKTISAKRASELLGLGMHTVGGIDLLAEVLEAIGGRPQPLGERTRYSFTRGLL